MGRISGVSVWVVGFLISGSVAFGQPANILVYDVNTGQQHGLMAAQTLGPDYSVVRAASEGELTTQLSTGSWDLLVLDVPSSGMTDPVATEIVAYITGGGKAMMGYWNLDSPSPGGILRPAFGVASGTDYTIPLDVYAWVPDHPIFTVPNPIPSPIVWENNPWADDGDRLIPIAGTEVVGGFTVNETPGEAGIVLTPQTICNGFVFDSFGPSIRPFLQNQMIFLLEGGGPVLGQFIRGDVNQDGMYDVSDIVFLLAAVFIPGSPAPECQASADLNDDGLVDVSDAVYGLAALFIPGAPGLPDPSPDCGADPTPDALTCDTFTCP